jgi:hypothetical protein
MWSKKDWGNIFICKYKGRNTPLFFDAMVSIPNKRYLSEPIALYQTEEKKEKKLKNEAELFGAYAIKFNQEYEKKQS